MANKFCLIPRDEIDAAFADMYAEQLHDIYQLVNDANFESDPAKQKILLENLFNTTIPNNLKVFEARLVTNGCGVLAGKEISYADIYLSSMLDFLGTRKDEILRSYPSVHALDARIRALPKISDWLAKRPKTDF